MTDSNPVRLDALVSGWVQGVGFRVFVARSATGLGLAGWVRNEPEGRVRVVAEGPRPALVALLAALEAGPAGANVTAVSAAWSDGLGTFDGFEIRSGSTPGD
jgi:acylphosphatase